MKTEQQYLNEAKEEVANRFNDKSFDDWFFRMIIINEPKPIQKIAYDLALLALQKQREDIKKELKDKIVNLIESSFDNNGESASTAYCNILEILNTL